MSDEPSYWTHEHRADVTKDGANRTTIHLDGFHASDGSPAVLAVCAFRDTTADDPEGFGIVVGEPAKSPLLAGTLPVLGGFSCGADAAERLAHELLAAAALVRATRRG